MARNNLCSVCVNRPIRHCPSSVGLGVLLYCPHFERRIPKSGHRAIVEEEVGRKLAHGECVHHINGKHNDNRPENLFICSHREHVLIHRMMRNGKSAARSIDAIVDGRKQPANA